MKKAILSILITLFTVNLFAIDIYDLKCEMQAKPYLIDTKSPRFSWRLKSDIKGDYQTAYQITVKKGKAIVWDSGKINSDQSQFITYKGEALIPEERYTWNVKVWDKNNKEKQSKDSFFEAAPQLDTKKVTWIGAIKRGDAHLPIGRRDFHGPSFKNKEHKAIFDKIDTLAMRSINLRKNFSINKEVDKAIVYASGLGHYNLFINGEKISDDIFTPVWSDYDKTVYYNAYQVDSILLNGDNAIGVTLGNGFYNTIGNRYRKLWISFGPPTLFLQMNIFYKDGTKEVIKTSPDWKYTPSPIVFNDMFGGEDYDARLEQEGWSSPKFDDSNWRPVVIQKAPKGVLRPQNINSIKKMKEYDVVSMTKVDTSYVFNMGQNLSGYPAIKLKGKKGQTVKITVGELLFETSKKDSEVIGKVSQRQSGGPHTYSYTLKGDGIETWHPEFTYYGYQYIQIDGANVLSIDDETKPVILDVKSHFVYNSADSIGYFKSSNEIFNKAHELIKNAVRSNMQSVFTDCPHREKLGWLEETHLNGPGLYYNWDITRFIPKMMQDVADGQHKDGLVPNIVPEYVEFGGDFTDSPEWGAASIITPLMYYQFYGDSSLLSKHYGVMKKYVDYLTSRATKHIVSHGLGDWYDYGEHRAGYSKNSPIPLSATAHYYYLTSLLSEIAKSQNNNKDYLKYSKLAEKIKAAYNKEFFNLETKQYGTNSQFSNAISVYMNLVEPQYKEEVLNNLVTDIKARGTRLTTGDVGNRYLYLALAQNGFNELLYEMHNHQDAPGYGFQIKFGVTTLTEQWDPRKGASWNHFMMGQIDEWFFAYLAGIKAKTPGFQEFIIEPKPVGDLKFIDTTFKSLYGDIKVHWTRENNDFNLSITVPVNTTANVILPNGVQETVKSGDYTFSCTLEDKN